MSAYVVNRDDERIDYDDLERLARECQPCLIFAGGSAYPRNIDFARIRAVADDIGVWLDAAVVRQEVARLTACYPVEDNGQCC